MKPPSGGSRPATGSRSATSPSGVRPAVRETPVRTSVANEPLSILFAHDAMLGACRLLCDAVSAWVGRRGGTITVASSAQDAAEQLRFVRDHRLKFDVAMIGLDLQPAPLAGTRLADFAIHSSVPVILVTRSLRWLPTEASHLRILPWLTPDASGVAIDLAIGDALRSTDADDARDSDDRVSVGF
jgi:hypothetical protein